MFLRHLTQPEGKAFVALAKQLIASDDREMPAETGMLRSMEAELGVSSAGIAAAAPNSELLGTFANDASRAAVVLELLGLACADGCHHPREAAVVRSVASGLGISEVRLLQMENWVLRQMSLVAEADGFLGKEE